jgi:hypothetical protein
MVATLCCCNAAMLRETPPKGRMRTGFQGMCANADNLGPIPVSDLMTIVLVH